MTEKSGQLGAFLKQNDFREINHVNFIFCSQCESGHERKAEAGQDLAGQGLVCSQCEGEGADVKPMLACAWHCAQETCQGGVRAPPD